MSRRQTILWLLGIGTVSLAAGLSLQKSLWQLFSPNELVTQKLSMTEVLSELQTMTSVQKQTNLTQATSQSTTTQSSNIDDAYQIITQALAIGDTKIHLSAGNYSVSNTIKITQPNVEIYGDGPTTMLRLNDNVLHDMFSFVTANNFHVHDLQLDGNRMNQPYTPPTPRYGGAVNISGIDAWNSSNGLIENCYIHDCRSFGIAYSQCTSCQILGNTIQNCDANGVTVDNASGGSGSIVRGNTIDGASDVGITGSDAVNFLVEKNVVKNITMNTSPFEQNTNIGLACEGAMAGCKNCSYTDNMIENTLIGAYIGYVNGLSFRNNTINGIIATGNGFPGIPFAINVDTKTAGVDAENNLIEGLPAAMESAIVQLLSPTGGTFRNNTIYTNSGKLPIWAPNGLWNISGNRLM